MPTTLPRDAWFVVLDEQGKTLQMEVKQISLQLGRLPTRDDVQRFSQFPIEYFDNYFISWAEVCAAARTTGMSEMFVPNHGTTIIKTSSGTESGRGIARRTRRSQFRPRFQSGEDATISAKM